ncbi:apolipoprotein N-acyltransferase [Xinfangfangia sp. CPCC 101601]|uniref:Apolipoprotein N-acyltransferase n=1 Tax=Pseudogemmobacter lacusdianii TaxID=3069608 RepID=A0ABU0VWS4_9RHOB|nr:apolipoprotein N-acyltransferase [Xinfangfangia sp. CPCC 101601]MDQ2066068.1 apolipoprotein N-acyltransferase [Xinfangfangia sp. CPCC 101601]
MSVALGAGVALGQVPFGLHIVALAALCGVLALLVRQARARDGFAVALFAGAGHFALALNWIVQPFFVDPWVYGWMAPFALALLAFGLALFWAGASALAVRLARPGGLRLLALVAALALADLARGYLLTGFPWALFGHLALDTSAEQLAALIGGYGLGALVLALCALPVLAPKAGTAASVAVLAGVLLWGQQHARLAPSEAGEAPVVRLVQPAIAQSLKWNPEEARANFDLLMALTESPLEAAPALALWPETAVPYLMTEGEGAALALGGLKIPVASGYQRVEGDGRQAWNSFALFGPGGSIGPSYDKVHLVPFGEYIPFGDLAYRLFGLRAFAAQQGAGYTAGRKAELMDFGPALNGLLGRARVLICYEAIFPEEVWTEERPAWILQITNDAWFGTLTGPYQHFAQARLRAIEQGLPLVRVANTGISAVVDARGQVVADVSGAPALMGMGARGVLDVALPGALPAPLYARSGDLPLVVLLLAALGFAAIGRGARERT